MRLRFPLASSSFASLIFLLFAGCGGDDTPRSAFAPDAASDASDATDAIDANAPDAPDAPDAIDADVGDDAQVDAGDALDAGDTGATFDANPIACESGVPVTIRLVAANLSSGNKQSWDPGDGGRILKALHPDVVMMQEFNYGTNSTADVQSFVTRYLGAGFTFTRGTGQIPNGVVSRYPIVASGEWTDASVSNRAFVWARLDVPGDRDLVAVSVHLLTSSTTSRDAEAKQLSGYLKTNVTDGSFIAVGGDFNTAARTEPALSSFTAVAVTSAPWPADQASNGNTNASRSKPYDWVIASPALDANRVPVALGGAMFGAGLVFDTRVFQPLSALNEPGDPDAVLSTDSAAANMQHMAVVRDFAVACP